MMTRTLTLLGLLAVLLGTAGGAGAQTLIHSTDWTSSAVGSTTAGSAGTTTGAGDGWIDNAGNVATAGSAGKLTIAGGSSPWSSGTVVLRPSSESVRDEQQAITFASPGSNGTGNQLIFRWQGGNTDYFIGLYFANGGSTLTLYRNSGGSYTTLGSSQGFTLPPAGDMLALTGNVTGASPTTFSANLTDTTAGTTLVNNYSQADSSGPQVAGQMGLSSYGTSSVLTDKTYNLAQATPVVLSVNSSACRTSPGNWSGDTGRSGSAFRQSWCPGAYITFAINASASPSALLNVSNQTAGSYVSYTVNSALHDNVAVPASGGIALSGLVPSALNAVTMYCRNSPQSARWNDANAWKVTGLNVDSGSSAAALPASSGKWVLEIGDSITEGINADASGNPNNLTAYSYLVGQSLLQQGYEYGVSACGYSGWLRPGDSGGDVPAYYPVSGGAYSGGGRWNQIDSATSLLDANSHISAYGSTGQEPSAITINYGTNEQLNSSSLSDMQASVTQGLVALRGAAPNAWIFAYVPFNLYATSIYSSGPSYVSALKAGVSAYQSSHPSDAKMVLIDFGTLLSSQVVSLSATVHPNAAGHAVIAAQAAGAILSKIAPITSVLYLGGGQIKRGR